MNTYDDTIDTREIIARIEELEAEREALTDHVEECQAAYEHHDGDDTKSTPEWDDLKAARAQLREWNQGEDAEELAQLVALMEELKGYGGDEQWRGDWYPLTLIRDSYFEQYMDDLIADIGDIPRDLPAYVRIELDYTMLQQDYSSVDIDGVDYWYR